METRFYDPPGSRCTIGEEKDIPSTTRRIFHSVLHLTRFSNFDLFVSGEAGLLKKELSRVASRSSLISFTE